MTQVNSVNHTPLFLFYLALKNNMKKTEEQEKGFELIYFSFILNDKNVLDIKWLVITIKYITTKINHDFNSAATPPQTHETFFLVCTVPYTFNG